MLSMVGPSLLSNTTLVSSTVLCVGEVVGYTLGLATVGRKELEGARPAMEGSESLDGDWVPLACKTPVAEATDWFGSAEDALSTPVIGSLSSE